jgi:hypothetical protein
MAALVLAGGLVTYHALAGDRGSKGANPALAGDRGSKGANPEPAPENFGKEEEAIRFAKHAFDRHAPGERQESPGFRIWLKTKKAKYLPGGGTKARLDRKSGHWIVRYNSWAKIPSISGLVYPRDWTVIVKYQPSEHSWKEVWWYHHNHLYNWTWDFSIRRGPVPRGLGWLPYPAKRYKGRTLKDWADDLEEVDLDVIDRSRRSVQGFGDDGLPYLIVHAAKHPPGSEQRRLIAAFIRVPAAEAWRQTAIVFLHELLKDPAQATRDAARNALKQAGLQ